jgi:hypothetical protein
LQLPLQELRLLAPAANNPLKSHAQEEGEPSADQRAKHKLAVQTIVTYYDKKMRKINTASIWLSALKLPAAMSKSGLNMLSSSSFREAIVTIPACPERSLALRS